MTLTGGVKNAMVAVTRYISNNFSDSERQISMNNFLGVVEPVREQIVEAFSVEEILRGKHAHICRFADADVRMPLRTE